MQVEEEEYLVEELKKIEVRRKERERKAQDLQKLISAADRAPSGSDAALLLAAGGQAMKKKLKSQRGPSLTPFSIAAAVSTFLLQYHNQNYEEINSKENRFAE